MEKLMKNVKITISPFTPNLETVGKLTISVGPEYGSDRVGLTLNPNVVDYQETGKNSNNYIKIKQVMVSQSTEDTKNIMLTLKDPVITVNMLELNYEIKLLSISKENLQGQNFPAFEFLISEL